MPISYPENKDLLQLYLNAYAELKATLSAVSGTNKYKEAFASLLEVYFAPTKISQNVANILELRESYQDKHRDGDEMTPKELFQQDMHDNVLDLKIANSFVKHSDNCTYTKEEFMDLLASLINNSVKENNTFYQAINDSVQLNIEPMGLKVNSRETLRDSLDFKALRSTVYLEALSDAQSSGFAYDFDEEVDLYIRNSRNILSQQADVMPEIYDELSAVYRRFIDPSKPHSELNI